MRLRLAEQDRSRPARPQHGGRVGRGNVLCEHRRPVGRPDVLRVEEILDSEGHACERSARLAAHVRALVRHGLVTGAIEAERGERAEHRIEPADTRCQRVDNLDR